MHNEEHEMEGSGPCYEEITYVKMPNNEIQITLIGYFGVLPEQIRRKGGESMTTKVNAAQAELKAALFEREAAQAALDADLAELEVAKLL